MGKWYKLKDGVHVYKEGRYKVLQIRKKDNGEYTFYSCLVFNKGEIVAAEGIFGSYLNTKKKAIDWGMKKAKELKILK